MKKKIRRFFLLLLIVLVAFGYLSFKNRRNGEETLLNALSGELGMESSASATEKLKKILTKTSSMSDKELREEIRQQAQQRGVQLTDAQVQQIFDLCRMMEKLDPDQLKERVESIQSLLKKAGEAKSKASELFQLAEEFLNTGKSTMDRISQMMDGNG